MLSARVACPRRWAVGRRNRFVIRVAGDSMAPTCRRGDYLVCEYHRHAQDARPQVVVMADFATVDAGECAVKRLQETAAAWVFRSDNPRYADRVLSKTASSAADYPILGVVLYNLTQQTPVR